MSADLGLDTLLEWYEQMLNIRYFEDNAVSSFRKGLFGDSTHPQIAQEATAVGVISALDRQGDIVFSNHRGHGHFLSYCGDIEKLYLEIMGKPGGGCGGRGGRQHLHIRNFYSNGIQGGIVPVSTGMALAEKLGSSEAIVTVFLGDGTLGEGAVYESFNMASLWQLPVLFVLDNNGLDKAMQVSGNSNGNPL